MIPKFIKDYLDEEEIQQCNTFIKEQKLTGYHIEEDVTGMSPVHFEVTETGIGPNIWIVCGSNRAPILSEERVNSL